MLRAIETKLCNIWDEKQENPDKLPVNKMLLKAIRKLFR